MANSKRPFAVAAAGNATLLTGTGGLFGITIRESTAVAAAATVTVYDNTAPSGPVLSVIRLAANGNFNHSWKRGVKFGTGLTIAATGGDISGSLIVGSSGGLRAIPFAGVDALLRNIATQGNANVDCIVAAETAGAVAEWTVYDALTITGNAFAGYSHAANETAKVAFEGGVSLSTGLQYDQVAGAVSGAVYIS